MYEKDIKKLWDVTKSIIIYWLFIYYLFMKQMLSSEVLSDNFGKLNFSDCSVTSVGVFIKILASV